MSTKDAIATPIGRQRSELCSILYSGDRFWPFYNFQFFGGRELVIFFTDLGALAFSLALVGLVARGMENECHRSYFHPDWSPTERAMFDSLFWGPILAVLQFLGRQTQFGRTENVEAEGRGKGGALGPVRTLISLTPLSFSPFITSVAILAQALLILAFFFSRPASLPPSF